GQGTSLKRLPGEAAGHVDDAVDTAQQFACLSIGRLAGGFVGKLNAAERQRDLRQSGRWRSGTVEQHDARPCLAEALGHGAAEDAETSGHDDVAGIESCGHGWLSWWKD